MAIAIDHMLTAQGDEGHRDECLLSGRSYLWQHVSQSLNPQSGLTLIIGESGSGKSFWFHKLQQELNLTEAIVCKRNLSLMSLIKQFACLFQTPVPLGPHSVIDQAKIILSTLAFNEPHYLIIDNATWLSSDALIFLLHISQHNLSHNLNIILLGTPQLLQRTIIANTDNLYIHEIMLRGMDIKEIEAFIYATYHTYEPLDSVMVRRIHQAGGGAPRETMKLVKDTWHTLFRAPIYNVTKNNNKPSGHGQSFQTSTQAQPSKKSIKSHVRIIISLILFALIALLMNLKNMNISTAQSSNTSSPIPQAQPPYQLDLPILVQEPAETNALIYLSSGDDYIAEPELTNIGPQDLITPSLLTPLDIDERASAHPDDDDIDAPLPSGTTPLETTPSDDDITIPNTTPTYENAHPITPETPHNKTTTHSWLEGDGYTVQLGVSPHSDTSILKNIEQSLSNTPTHRVCLVRKTQHVCLLLLGPFDGQSQATHALRQLPSSLIQQQKPWVRTLKSVRLELANES